MENCLVLGIPGSGKTERLLKVMEASLERGIHPSRIAMVTYTRAAANEAKERACKLFGLTDKDLPYCRTIHSLAFRELGLRRDDVVGEEHLGKLAEVTGELVKNTSPSFDDGLSDKRNADELLTVDHYARTTRKGLREAHYDHGGDIDWFRLKRFSEAYRLFKADMGLLDFTDMLDTYATSEMPPLPIDVAIVDEGQDLTLRQWDVVNKAFAGASEFWVAGDDDQQIHAWAGAAEDYFMSLSFKREVLPLSHRLPVEIFDFATKFIKQVKNRYPKENAFSSGRRGHIEWINRLEEIDLSRNTWLLMARTRSQLSGMVSLARSQGVVYSLKGRNSIVTDHLEAMISYEALRSGKRITGIQARLALLAMGVKLAIEEDSSYTALELGLDVRPIWHDALIKIPLETREYYLACRRRGESLSAPPRVRIETMHGAKGLQAENVLLATDLTWRTRKAYELDPDSEYRVFYVGLTRASERLFLMAPQTAYGFPL